MKRQFGALALSFGLVLAASAAHAAPLIGTFTGSAAGQGLDLEGDFEYALTMNALADGTVVGDARFTDAHATAGASVSHGAMNPGWYLATYTGSAADLALGQVMNTSIWSYANGGIVMGLTMSGLTVGGNYKVQLMFGEGCCNRGFDIWQDGAELASDFSPSALAGINNGARSAFVSNTFTAASTSVSFGFGGFAAGYGDNNPLLNAVTLEALDAGPARVPEPASLGMLAAGLGLIGFMRRKGRAA